LHRYFKLRDGKIAYFRDAEDTRDGAPKRI
jgi:hypothetical protein